MVGKTSWYWGHAPLPVQDLNPGGPAMNIEMLTKHVFINQRFHPVSVCLKIAVISGEWPSVTILPVVERILSFHRPGSCPAGPKYHVAFARYPSCPCFRWGKGPLQNPPVQVRHQRYIRIYLPRARYRSLQIGNPIFECPYILSSYTGTVIPSRNIRLPVM